MNVNYLTKGRH